MVIYLNIPYSEKKVAKEYGAIWDKDCKKWFCEDESNELCKLYDIYKEIDIIGEDRSYGGSELFIDMIPKTSYFKNVRSIFTESDWNLIRHHIYERTGHKCECCGAKRFKYLEAHERWIFDFETKTQKLIRIIALCRLCHQATHYGHSKVTKEISKINAHLMKVRGINEEELKLHIKEAFEIWEKRNTVKWIIDTSIISDSGFKVVCSKY
jgi:hypothetical protein